MLWFCQCLCASLGVISHFLSYCIKQRAGEVKQHLSFMSETEHFSKLPLRLTDREDKSEKAEMRGRTNLRLE